ncbi:hypothetical protein QC760_010612 [Botrytis cinerea]
MDIKMENEQDSPASINHVPDKDEEFEDALNFASNLDQLAQEKKEESQDDEYNIAKQKFVLLTMEMKKMTLDDQIKLQTEMHEALSKCQKLAKLEDGNKHNKNRIYASKVLAKVSASSAIVRITSLDRKGIHPNQEGYCHRVVDAASLNPYNLKTAVHYRNFNTRKISPAEARNIRGVAFAGDVESLEPGFSVRNALRAKKPKSSTLRENQQRAQHPTMYITGETTDGKMWILSRSHWNLSRAYKTPEKGLEECLNKAVNDFDNYVRQLQEGTAFIRIDTPPRSFTPGENDNARTTLSPSPGAEQSKKSTESDEHTDSDNDDSDDSKSEKSTESDKPKKSTKSDESEKSTKSDKPKESTESDEHTASDNNDVDSDVKMAI